MPLSKEQYADFLAGVRSTTWLRGYENDTGGSLAGSGGEKGDSEAPKEAKAATTEEGPGAAAAARWTPARITGVAVGGLISLTLLLLGMLMVSGVIAFARRAAVVSSPATPPRSA